jgi:TatD DNase family protein
LAKELNLPLILHIRKEYQLALNILKEMNFKGKAVFHFFKGKTADFEEILKNENYYFGFSGVITYDTSMDEIICEMPLDRMMIETDAPYVAPIPFRGELNRPEYVVKIAEKIAKLKGINIEQVLENTFENAIKFFNL